jgi:hypothetical protein
MPRSDKSGESRRENLNPSSSNMKIFGSWMNTEIIVDVKNIYKGESDFTHDVDAVFSSYKLVLWLHKQEH